MVSAASAGVRSIVKPQRPSPEKRRGAVRGRGRWREELAGHTGSDGLRMTRSGFTSGSGLARISNFLCEYIHTSVQPAARSAILFNVLTDGPRDSIGAVRRDLRSSRRPSQERGDPRAELFVERRFVNAGMTCWRGRLENRQQVGAQFARARPRAACRIRVPCVVIELRQHHTRAVCSRPRPTARPSRPWPATCCSAPVPCAAGENATTASARPGWASTVKAIQAPRE